MVWSMSSSARNSLNWWERNSPALSNFKDPTERAWAELPTLSLALKLATNSSISFNASLFFLRKRMNLYRVWSSTSTSAYWKEPMALVLKGPTMSPCTRRPGYEAR